ncbi:hypothetical protein GF324_01790, partial [bacterium]|nr:hypothetical protein [bacterium]
MPANLPDRWIICVLVPVLTTLLLLPEAGAQPRELRYYSDYMYITHREHTIFNEVIWFWTPDVLWGRVHSNDEMGMKYRPTFYGQVTTSAEGFLEFCARPYFALPPIFEVPRIPFFSSTTDTLPALAAEQGHYFHTDPGMEQRQYRLEWIGDCWRMSEWPTGVPWDSTAVLEVTEFIPAPEGWNHIWADGPLQTFGEDIRGKNTIGSSHSILLVDNLAVEGTDFEDPGEETYGTVPDTSHHQLVLA